MSFWSGKKESLNQSLVEITFRAVLSGLVIVFFAQFLIARVDNQIEVASKRDALNTFRNSHLSKLTTRFSDAFLALDEDDFPRTQGDLPEFCVPEIGRAARPGRTDVLHTVASDPAEHRRFRCHLWSVAARDGAELQIRKDA